MLRRIAGFLSARHGQSSFLPLSLGGGLEISNRAYKLQKAQVDQGVGEREGSLRPSDMRKMSQLDSCGFESESSRMGSSCVAPGRLSQSPPGSSCVAPGRSFTISVLVPLLIP